MVGHYDLAAHYRKKIESRDLIAGDRLPIEGELAELHGVSRATISRFVQLLKSEGLLYTTHAGTFVGPRPPDPRTQKEQGPRLIHCANRLFCNNYIELRTPKDLYSVLKQVNWISRGSLQGRAHFCHECAPAVLDREKNR